jgi:hypothetical protein
MSKRWGFIFLFLALMIAVSSACNLLDNSRFRAVNSDTSCHIAPDPLVSVNQDNWRDAFGCPTSNTSIAMYEWTPFERGSMLHDKGRGQVYIFFDAGTMQEVSATQQTAGDLPGEPPEGLTQPEGVFAVVWTNEPGVANALGWATTSPVEYDGLQQEFLENGTIVVALGNGDLVGIFPFSNNWSKLPVEKIPGYYGGMPGEPRFSVAVLGTIGLLVAAGLVFTRQDV